MKIFFIGSAFYILFLMKVRFKATWDPNLDTIKVEYLLGGSALLAILFHTRLSLLEVCIIDSMKIKWNRSFGVFPFS